MQAEKFDGTREMPTPFDVDLLQKALSRKDVKEVHVFNLKPGMEFNVKNRLYKVGSINSKGKKAIVHLEKIRDL